MTIAVQNRRIRSPLPWMGGKFYSASFLLTHFPAASDYDLFVDVFGGAASVLLSKPAGEHLEVYNDLNTDLVNCWMHLRDHPTEMEERLSTLPYARSLYYAYHQSLYDGTELDPMERAVRWFYVLRSSFRAEISERPNGWSGGIQDTQTLHAKTYRNVLSFQNIATRFQHVNIDCRDFENVVSQYEHTRGLRTLLYCDPPYIGSEQYYTTASKTDAVAFHERLARVLNATPALVALSYYEHPLLDDLYPQPKWRRVHYQTIKHSQRTKATHDQAQEVLLCNYEDYHAAPLLLFSEKDAGVTASPL